MSVRICYSHSFPPRSTSNFVRIMVYTEFCCRIHGIRALVSFVLFLGLTIGHIFQTNSIQLQSNTQSSFETATPMLAIGLNPTSNTVIAAGGHFGGRFCSLSLDDLSWQFHKPDTALSSVYSIEMVEYKGNNYAMAVDESGRVLLSLNDGETWQVISTFPTALYSLTSGGNQIFVAGQRGAVYISKQEANGDGYSDWSLSSVDHLHTIYDISTLDGIHLIHVTSAGSIYFSHDSGLTWIQSVYVAPGILYCLSHSETNVAYSAGTHSYFAKTSDGGETWAMLTVFPTDDETIRYNSISTHGVTHVYVAGSSGIVYMSSDAGSTWSPLLSLNTPMKYDSDIYALLMINKTNGVLTTGGFVVSFTLKTSVESEFVDSGKFLCMSLLFVPCLILPLPSFQIITAIR